MHPAGNRGIPLQRYLVQLYWLSVLPLLLLAGWLVYDNVRSVRSAQEQQATQIANNFASAVDRELQSRIDALTVLSQSPHLEAMEEWPQLYLEAQVLKSRLGMDVVLMDANPPRRMRFTTQAPFGADLPLPPRSQGFQALPAAIDTLQPAVSDLVTNVFTQRPAIAVVVPAIRNGRALYAIASPVDTERFQRLIAGFALPEGWALTLHDGTGQPLARAVPSDFVAAADLGAAGQVEVKFSRSRWKVMLEIPTSARRSPLLTTGAALALLLLAAILASAVAGWAGSRRLGRAVASLAQDGPDEADLDIAELRDVKALLNQARDRERLSEARFRRLFHDAPIGMRLADLKGNILAQNARFDEMFGYSIQDVPTLDEWMNRAYPDAAERERVAESWGRASSQARAGERKMYEGEYQIFDEEGQVHQVQVRGSVLADGMLSTFIDVTDQRRTESSLRLWAEAFERAELNLSISDSRTNRFRTVNPAFARLHGYEREEMEGMPVARLIPDDGQDTVKDRFAQEDAPNHAVLESVNLRKDGSRFPVQLDVTVLRDAKGLPVSRLVYATDLTERNRIRSELKSLHEDLERRVVERTSQLSQANRELDSFAYTVSHDLRAPLRAMDGYLHLIREEHGDQLPSEAVGHLDKIGAAIVRMKNLIEGILTLTHSARHDLQLVPVNLSELVQKRLGELASLDPDRQHGLEVQPDLMATGDPRMLDVLITNLVDNAWKYTSKTVAPRIRFYSEMRDGKTWFCLGDNGAGFDPTHAAKLFQPFQRMHRHDEFPGIGIGLATVHRIVQRHRGEIMAEARPGGGAIFRFTLDPEQSGPDPQA